MAEKKKNKTKQTKKQNPKKSYDDVKAYHVSRNIVISRLHVMLSSGSADLITCEST